MNESNYKKDFWLTREQELLLKAALLQGNDAISAWEKWKSSVDFSQIDPGSYRLLPLLYYNLNKYEIKDPIMSRIKGIYRRTWYENQILSNQTVKILQLFHTAGIRTIVLKGIAFINLYYKNYGLRPMSDFDILVPTKQANEAIKILMELRWIPQCKSPESIIPIIHSCDLTDPTGLHHLDLHWHLFIECCQPNADDDFWDSAIAAAIKDVHTNFLNPADQLLHTCIHGMKWSKIPPFRWVADAMMILNSSQTKIDWNRLITQAEKCRLTLPLKHGLEYLVKNFNAFIPHGVLEKIQKISISKIEQIEYNYKIRNQKKKLLGNIPVLWFDSLRLSGNGYVWQKLWGFIKYLKHFWNIENLWQLPFYVLNLSVNKIKLLSNLAVENINESSANKT